MAPQSTRSDQHSEEHWPGGLKIMMTLRSATPKGKEKARWQMVKPMLGIAGRALLKANCQGVPIIAQPRKGRKIREHNTDMTETRAARVEQNTRHKAEPSTLYQVYRCINYVRYIVISQQVIMFQQGTTSPCSNKEQTSIFTCN